MYKLLDAARRWINRKLWKGLKQFAAVVRPMPVLAAFVLLILLAQVGQLHEIYIAYLEPPFDAGKLTRLVIAVPAIALVSCALFYANYALSTIRIDVIYQQSGNNYANDLRLKFIRNIAGLLTAFAPWLGIAWGMHKAAEGLSSNVENLRFSIAPLADRGEPFGPLWETIRLASYRLEIGAVLVVAMGLALLYLLHRTRRKHRVRMLLIATGIAVLVLVLIVPRPLEWLTSGAHSPFRSLHMEFVSFYRALGPLAMIHMVALLAISLIAVLAFLSGQIGFPLVTAAFVVGMLAAIMHWPLNSVLMAMLLGFVLLALLGLASPRKHLTVLSSLMALFILPLAFPLSSGPSVVGSERPPAEPTPTLDAAFRAWLGARQTEIDAYRRARDNRDYPVFIIAAQGGGIYAASAAAAFLATLQDRCPAFAQHVFVISGVSGGAVGSSIFQSMLQGKSPDARGCAPQAPAQPGDLQRRTADVIRDDHLSPLLGLLPADLLGLERDRSLALERSFIASVMRHGDIPNLGRPYIEHWDPATIAPALLLNATWVETGYRVAFAPFTLNGMRDKTLYSFADAAMAIGVRPSVTLAEAAIASARFPGVVPPYMADVRSGQQSAARWNFVDGGYSDGSGASSALEIYKGLEPIAKANRIDLRLILLTDTRPEVNFLTVAGTAARDLLAPALTVLKVRDLLARQAVMRTISEVEDDPEKRLALQGNRSAAQLGQMDNWKATLVELDREAFSLALSWRISTSTHSIVSLLSGRPEFCRGISQAAANPAEAGVGSVDAHAGPVISTQTIRANSCVAQAIGKLIDVSSTKAP